MAMDWNSLADEIASAMGYSPTSDEIKAFARGTVEGVQTGVPTFGGVPTPHTITALVPATMAALIMGYAGYPSVTTQLLGYCTGVCNHIMAAGIITYTGPTPPPPIWNIGGTLAGLDGSACAALVAASAGYPSVTSKLEAECTAVCDHLVANMQIEAGVIS